MAEQIAGPSTVPAVPVSTPIHIQSISKEDSSSSPSPTLTALETPASHEPIPSELETAESTQADELPTVTAAQQPQTPISSPKPSPQDRNSGSATIPPRTQPGIPVSLKRDKATVSTKATKSVQSNQSDEHTPWHGVVVDYAPQKEQAVIFPAKMVYSSPNIPYNNEGWAFQRAMGYSDYIGSGYVFINVHGEKRKRNVKDNTYVFIVLEGAVEVLIHQTSYAVSAGGVFVVPRDTEARNKVDGRYKRRATSNL
ncbi:hypothetical protein J132_09316 [Termitomyces sp. J132]|nr:hypothetical protein J132_09316 [Termitomyces sp. J132]